MASVLQFAAFFYLCCLLRNVVTHSNQDAELNIKRSNSNDPNDKDFYFGEQKGNDDNVKTGRAISQSAWSKEEKDKTHTVEKKSEIQLSGEFGLKSVLSYLLDTIHELKKDIFGIKEMALNSTNFQNNFEERDKENKTMGKSDDSSKSTDFRNENQQPKPNYITDYYQKNGIKFVDDEDLENFRDTSDDSSHKPDDEIKVKEKNNENTRKFKRLKTKSKPDKYSFGVEKTTAIPPSQRKIPEDNVKKSDDGGNANDNYFRKSTSNPSQLEQINSKESKAETERETVVSPKSRTGKCVKKNKENSADNLKEKNDPNGTLLRSAEYEPTEGPQNKNSDTEKSSQDKTDNNNSPGENLKNKGASDFDNKPCIVVLLTTPSSQNENESYELSRKEEQTTSPTPGDKKQTQNGVKLQKTIDQANKHTTFSPQNHKAEIEDPNKKVNTVSYTLETQIDDGPKESEGITKEPGSKKDGQKTNIFDIGNSDAPTTSAYAMNVEIPVKDSTDNLNNRKETNKNDELQESGINQQNPNGSKAKADDIEVEQTKAEKLNNNPQSPRSLKNENNNANLGDDNKGENNNLDSTTTKDLPSQRSNQSHNLNEFVKPQEAQQNNENLNNKTEMLEILPNQEYDYEGESDDFDVYDESNENQNFDPNQDDELDMNDENIEDNDEINAENTELLFTSETQTPQNAGYVMEKNSEEQYNTFLEYLYKHSNNSFFQSLKNQSNNFS